MSRFFKRHDREIIILGALILFVVWLLMYTHAVRLEEQTAMRSEFMLDNTGTPVRIYKHGRVWELGKGYREATQEEEEYDLDRKEGEQR